MTKIKKTNFLLLFRHSSKESIASTPDEIQAIFGKWVAWMKGLKAEGNLVGADRLEDGGKVLRSPRGATVTDGPFVESKEIVAGYVIVSAEDLKQAAEIARGCPGLEYGYIVEVRPIEQLPAI
jgi:hypothetical protein